MTWIIPSENGVKSSRVIQIEAGRYLYSSPRKAKLSESSALGQQQLTNVAIMKKAPSRPQKSEIRNEYSFDYSKSRPNRFAEKMKKDRVAVVLDPDVAEVFASSTSVNTMLRSVISGLPKTAMKKTRRAKSAG